MESIPESENPATSVDPTEDNRIRRPPNAFMLFGKQYRKVLAEKFDKLSNKEISKILGNEWKNMDIDMKNHFHSLAKETYRTHLEKYPDYHYNPLEARQRKAERKRKYKTSGVTHKSKTNQIVFQVIKPFGGNRSISFPNSTFSFSNAPTVRYVQPISGTGDSVIGIKRLNRTKAEAESIPPQAVPIEHIEHNYSSQPKYEPHFDQSFAFESTVDKKADENKTQMENTENQIDWNQSFEFLVNFLPPMDNPNAVEAIPVVQNCGQYLADLSNYRFEGIKQEFDINDYLSSDFDLLSNEVKKEIMESTEGESLTENQFILKEIKAEPIDD